MSYNKGKTIERMYWSIGEIAATLNVNPSLIRFWEKEFEVLRPKKGHTGNRQFTRDDIATLREIHRLVKVELYTIAGARRKLEEEQFEPEIKTMLLPGFD